MGNDELEVVEVILSQNNQLSVFYIPKDELSFLGHRKEELIKKLEEIENVYEKLADAKYLFPSVNLEEKILKANKTYLENYLTFDVKLSLGVWQRYKVNTIRNLKHYKIFFLLTVKK